jgi:hypothetical protein
VTAPPAHATPPWTMERQPPTAGRSCFAVGLTAGLLALALYCATCGRGVEWQDSGIHQYRILTGQLNHPLGLALTHPLHYWIGRALAQWPLGSLPLRLNLLSSVCGAIGVGVLAGLVVRVTRSRFAAGIAAASLALAHSYWQMSAVTETYTLAAALMTIEWALLWRFVRTARAAWLVAVFAVNGLHVADHLLGLLPLSVYGIFLLVLLVRRRITLASVATACIAWLITAAPYWTLVVTQWQQSGDFAATLRSALFGGGLQQDFSHEVLNTQVSTGQLRLAALAFGYCFPSAAILLALLGLLRRTSGRRRLFRRLMLAQTIVIAAFVARYSIKDIYTYFVPVCAITAFWIGCGVVRLVQRRPGTPARKWVAALLIANALLPPFVYCAFPLIAAQRGWMRSQLRHIPGRNEYFHFFRPWRCADHSAADFAGAALTTARPTGWILADSTTAFPIAVTALIDPEPPRVRVYWTVRPCLVPPRGAPFSAAALSAEFAAGGRIFAAPSPEIAPLLPSDAMIETREPLWQILPAAATSAPS